MSLFERVGAEHAWIASVSDALDAFVEQPYLDPHEVIRFVTFLRGYADGLHHEREESVLLASLELAGFSSGPLTFIRDQHKEEALLLLKLEKAASAKAPWGAAERAAIAEAAHMLTAFQRAHMEKERELLLPVAAKELTPHAEAVHKAESRFERTRVPRWDVLWLEKLAAELVAAHAPVRG